MTAWPNWKQLVSFAFKSSTVNAPEPARGSRGFPWRQPFSEQDLVAVTVVKRWP